MKDLDLKPLKDNDAQYEKLVGAVESAYKCDWDDAVHDSYAQYIEKIRELSREIRDVRCKVETLEKEADELKIDELKKKADAFCREANAI